MVFSFSLQSSWNNAESSWLCFSSSTFSLSSQFRLFSSADIPEISGDMKGWLDSDERPEGWLTGCGPEGWLAGCGPEGWLAGCGPEGWLAGCRPEGWLAGCRPEGWLAGCRPEGWLAGDWPEEEGPKVLLKGALRKEFKASWPPVLLCLLLKACVCNFVFETVVSIEAELMLKKAPPDNWKIHLKRTSLLNPCLAAKCASSDISPFVKETHVRRLSLVSALQVTPASFVNGPT